MLYSHHEVLADRNPTWEVRRIWPKRRCCALSQGNCAENALNTEADTIIFVTAKNIEDIWEFLKSKLDLKLAA